MIINHERHEFRTVSKELTRDEVERLGRWCEAVLSPNSELATALEHSATAVAAFVDGQYVKMTSAELWDRGFEASEMCSGYDGGSFFAIFDADTNEISVCCGDTNATISLTSGTMMVI